MELRLLKHLILFFALYLNAISVKSNDSTQIFISTNYSFDLSDTYSGGELFSGEITVSRSWYGIKAAFGHFQSQYIYVFQVPYPEIERTLLIDIPEMSMMKIATLSGFLRPIEKSWFKADIVFGASIGRAKCFYMKNVDYEYLIAEERFNHLFVDYYLHKVNYFGYHAGLDLSFYLTKKFGIQAISRIHDMSNGGTFFFVGGGMIFKIK